MIWLLILFALLLAARYLLIPALVWILDGPDARDSWGPHADWPIDLTLTDRGHGWLDEQTEVWHG